MRLRDCKRMNASTTPMRRADGEVIVECPLGTRWLIFLGVPAIVLLLVVSLALMGGVPFLPYRSFGHRDIQLLLLTYSLGPAMAALSAWSVWVLLRYREALTTTIRVSASGVTVQNPHYGVLMINWADVQATYSRIGKMLVLQSPRLARPLAIMNFATGYGPTPPRPEFLAAKALVQSSVGERWNERWLVL